MRTTFWKINKPLVELRFNDRTEMVNYLSKLSKEELEECSITQIEEYTWDSKWISEWISDWLKSIA